MPASRLTAREATLVNGLLEASAELHLMSIERKKVARRRAQIIERLQEAGWSLQRIADEAGVSKNAIVMALKRAE